MSNPYQSPLDQNQPSSRAAATQEVAGPALSLIIVASIAIALGVIGLGMNAFLILSGAVERLEEMNQGPISEYMQITIRAIWGVVLLIAAIFVLYGSIKMKSMTNYGLAKATAIVAMIPCIGPCCLLGIPFGIWTFIVLSKPNVRDAFR